MRGHVGFSNFDVGIQDLFQKNVQDIKLDLILPKNKSIIPRFSLSRLSADLVVCRVIAKHLSLR